MKKIIPVILFVLMMSFTSFADKKEEISVINIEYQNIIETSATGIGYKDDGSVLPIGREVPVTIHYNDSYQTESGSIIKINEIKVTEEGVPIAYTGIEAGGIGDRAEVNKKIKCNTSDGESILIDGYLWCHLIHDKAINITDELLREMEYNRDIEKNKVTIVSVEVWIYQ